MDELALAEQLGRAGLTFLGWPDRSAVLVPVSVARYAVSCPAGDSRIDVKLRYSDASWWKHANDAWLDIASRGRLFGRDNDFLIAIALRSDVWPVRSTWAIVRLAAVWDIAGEGAAGLLGSGRHRPEFVMLAVDGRAIVQGTVWQDGIGFLAVRNPRRAEVLRQRAEFLSTWERADPEERLAARAWLEVEGG